MSTEQYFNTLEFIMRHDEEAAEIIRRICKYYNLKEKIQDRIKIANLSQSSRSHLKTIFNSETVKPEHIDLKMFFETLNYSKEDWINKIFEILGIQKKSKREEEAEKKETERLLLKRIGLSYSKFPNIISYIEENSIQNKYDTNLIINSLKVFEYVINNTECMDFSELGAKVLNNTKTVRVNTDIYNLTYKFLKQYTDISVSEELISTPKRLYEFYNVISNPTAIKVTLYGPFIYYKNSIKFEFIKKLWENGESVVLSMDNLKNIDSIELDKNIELLTCENESPFNSLIRKKEKFALIYTSGYPNSAVKKILELLKEKKKTVYHWGDSDFDGYQIAGLINKIIPVKLWRCDINSLNKKKRKLTKINDRGKLYKIEQFIVKNPSFPFNNELLFTIKHGWLEQENY